MTFVGTLVLSKFAWRMNIVTQDGKYFTCIIHFNKSEHNNKYYSRLGFKFTHVW